MRQLAANVVEQTDQDMEQFRLERRQVIIIVVVLRPRVELTQKASLPRPHAIARALQMFGARPHPAR